MVIDVSQFRGAFFEEAEEHLQTMETVLLDLEARPGDPELLQRIFRAAHSLKGASGTFGFAEMARLTHHLEEVLDELREGKTSLSPDLTALLLLCADALRGLLAAAKEGVSGPDITVLVEEIARARGRREPLAKSAEPPSEGTAPAAAREVTVTFYPGADTLRTGMDPLLLLRDLAELGEVVERTVDASALPPLAEMDPESCHLGWTVRLHTASSEAEIADVFTFVEDTSRIQLVESAAREGARAPDPAAPKPAAEREARRAQGAARAHGALGASSLRVATEKLDKLVDLVGELVIAQAMVAQAMNDPSPAGAARLSEAMAAMDRNTRELQERVMAVRMVPIGAVLSRFPRLVHDLAASLGKQVELELSGEDTELDKGVVEQLADPLTHLVRNALDHGIEAPEVRRAAGKPEAGRVHISAQHVGGSVVIEVTDDGRGVQTERIRRKAIAAGIVREDEDLTDDELHALVFHAGLSTAEVVTDVSGRGVGMDVVKRNVEALNGTVALSSRRERGSTARIRIPLTMAVMEGLALRVGAQTFVLPLIAISESFRPKPQQVKTILGRGEVVLVRGESIPLVRLHEALAIPTDVVDPTQALVCVVDAGSARVGLMVDEPLGQSQVVVKSLENNYRKVDGIMGATILGDGRVALILDPTALSRRAARTGHTKETGHGADERAA